MVLTTHNKYNNIYHEINTNEKHTHTSNTKTHTVTSYYYAIVSRAVSKLWSSEIFTVFSVLVNLPNRRKKHKALDSN